MKLQIDMHENWRENVNKKKAENTLFTNCLKSK